MYNQRKTEYSLNRHKGFDKDCYYNKIFNLIVLQLNYIIYTILSNIFS